MRFDPINNPVHSWVYYLWHRDFMIPLLIVVLLFIVSGVSLMYLRKLPEFRQKRAMVVGAWVMPWVWSALILLPAVAEIAVKIVLRLSLVRVPWTFPWEKWWIGLWGVVFCLVMIAAVQITFTSWVGQGPFAVISVGRARRALRKSPLPASLGQILEQQMRRSQRWKLPLMLLWLLLGFALIATCLARMF